MLDGKAPGDQDSHTHAIPGKVTGHCISMLVHLIPTPTGTWVIIPAPWPNKLSRMASVKEAALPLEPEATLPPWATLPRPPLMPFPTSASMPLTHLCREQVSMSGIH